MLHDKYGCNMQCGGDDQWSNILGGKELVRRKEGEEVYGMTFSLLTTSEGKKMGKTQAGAVWLDPEKTSPYEFFQYWRNVEDADVYPLHEAARPLSPWRRLSASMSLWRARSSIEPRSAWPLS